MLKRSYAVNHFFCGCHTVEARPGVVDINESTFCSNPIINCDYILVIRRNLMWEEFITETE